MGQCLRRRPRADITSTARRTDKESSLKAVYSPPKAEPKESGFAYNDFISGLKDSKFKRILFLTGAGISVSAGIPDFRTPGTGLYSQIQKYNLPTPEAVFSIDFFQRNPDPFYLLSKEFLGASVKPVVSHLFQRLIQDKKLLLSVLTQNIDGLELEAGVELGNILQAHGHMRTAHCISCRQEASIEKFNEHVKAGTIYKCEKCSSLVKPDIVFFGEDLPSDYGAKTGKIRQADLVFVMGTSLKVQPFASLIYSVRENVPIVLINRENPGVSKNNLLFLSGSIDENVKKIIEDCGWTSELERLKSDMGLTWL